MKLKKDFEDKIEKNENCKKDMENEIKNLLEKLQKTTIEKEESNKRLEEEVSELSDKIRTEQGYQKEREYAEELLKVERDRLEKEKKEISETLQNIKQELVRETTKNQNLRQTSDQVKKQWNEERMTLKEDISDGSVIIETLQNEKKNYMKEIENLNHEVKHHKQKVEGAKDDIKSKEEENKQLQQQYQKIQEMCNQKQAEIERMKLEHSESKKHLVSKEESIIKLKKDIETLELGIRNKSERNKAILEEKIFLKKKLETTNGKVESLTKDLEKKSSEAEKTSVNLQSKERENKQLRDDMEKKDEEIGRLERQIAKPPVVLGIRNTKSGLSSKDSKMITEELSRILESRFKRENIDLKIKPCTTPQENPNGPLLVLCLSTTRIGSNVKDALEGIRASKDIAVLVMHHMKQEDLSSMYHTKHQIGGQYKELGGIFDMVFLGDQGVYDCEFNAETIQHLSTLIMQYSRRY